jgi:hypothetical protein
MDKTDLLTTPPGYLKGETARVRNKRRNADGTLKFGKISAPKDQTISRINRAGVTGGGDAPRGISLTQYHRRRFLHVALTFNTNVGEQILIKPV